MREPEREEQSQLVAETREAREGWGIAPKDWSLVGALPGARSGAVRPVVAIDANRWVLRRQAPHLNVDDTRFRHAFMALLSTSGLPVPVLSPTPSGLTWSLTGGSIYELQAYAPGEPFATDPSPARVEAVARLLGALHQTSVDFSWAPRVWPEERSASGLARSYVALIREAGERYWAGSAIGHNLLRTAEACDTRIAAATDALSLPPSPPEIHIHGDFQPHNLAFSGQSVVAIYDFEAARWDQRVYELAYALLMFTGLSWSVDESVTPPRVDDGLDIVLARRFLGAYGREAPPSEDEAARLADALALVFPIAFANGVAEDLVFADEFDGEPDEQDALDRLAWAERFWLWADRFRSTLAEAWESG
ncbi:MAG TPA: phosphotransferase [Ktedonobacterales bacterium]